MGLLRTASILLIVSMVSTGVTAYTNTDNDNAAAAPTEAAVATFMSSLAISGCGTGSTDLSSLHSSSTDLVSDNLDDSFVYYMNMCGATNTPTCQQHNMNAMVCQVAKSPYSDVYTLAEFGGGKAGNWSYLGGVAHNGIQVIFDNGDGKCVNAITQPEPRVITLQFTCAKQQDAVFRLINNRKVTPCSYLLTMNTPAACPASSSGLSGGWIFIIILVCCSVTYVVAGCIYKAKQLGATGVDRCPNVEFWRELPGLVKEGCFYTVEKTKQLCGGMTTGGGSGSAGNFDTI